MSTVSRAGGEEQVQLAAEAAAASVRERRECLIINTLGVDSEKLGEGLPGQV